MDYTFSYTFSEQCGPSYYSPETDEEFYDEEDYDWEYGVSEAEVCNAWIDMCNAKDSTLEEKCIMAIEDLMTDKEISQLLKDTNKATLADLVKEATVKGEQPVTAHSIMEYVLGDISTYVDRDEYLLNEYFEEAAYQNFRENRY